MFDAIFKNLHAVTLADAHGLGIIKNAAIGVQNGAIAFIGTENDLPGSSVYIFDQKGAWVTPALIDCHTHLIYAGTRVHEHQRRLSGESYESMAASGGGILSTVSATRAASEDELEQNALARIKSLFQDGVAAFEIKSGYGLDKKSEEKMLRVATKLQEGLGLKIQRTFLGAHAIPPEFSGRGDDYIDHLCAEILPHLHALGLIDAVDAFCEKMAFSTTQVEKLFKTAQHLKLPVKIHAEQRSLIGASKMAARFKPLSCDHVEYCDEETVQAMAECGTVATLLPCAYYTLREKIKPPVDLFKKHGVPMAVATDHNPGTSPVLSLRLAMNMACVLFGLSAEESLRGATINAARALGWQKTLGSLEAGKDAQLAFWNVNDPLEIIYTLGGKLCSGLYVSGNYHDFTA